MYVSRVGCGSRKIVLSEIKWSLSVSKIQFITLIVTLVGVQVAAQYFLSHGYNLSRDEVSSPA